MAKAAKTSSGKTAPERIFLHAASFREAQRVLVNSVRSDTVEAHALAMPSAVISAFTSELLIKCLVCIETGHTPQGHNLLTLFRLLSSKTQKHVEELWDNYALAHQGRWIEFERVVGPLPRDLHSALAAGSKTFELARYVYEEREEFMFYVGALPDMLVRVVFELKPDWLKTAEDAWNELYKK
jgi:hypothetical protein